MFDADTRRFMFWFGAAAAGLAAALVILCNIDHWRRADQLADLKSRLCALDFSSRQSVARLDQLTGFELDRDQVTGAFRELEGWIPDEVSLRAVAFRRHGVYYMATAYSVPAAMDPRVELPEARLADQAGADSSCQAYMADDFFEVAVPVNLDDKRIATLVLRKWRRE